MAKEQTSPTLPEAPKHAGLVPSVAHLALDAADRGQSTLVAVLNDARTEVRAAVDHSIELAEKLAAGGFRFTRKLTQRIDEATADALGGIERVLGTAVKQARETTKAAAELATTATSTVTGRAQA